MRLVNFRRLPHLTNNDFEAELDSRSYLACERRYQLQVKNGTTLFEMGAGMVEESPETQCLQHRYAL